MDYVQKTNEYPMNQIDCMDVITMEMMFGSVEKRPIPMPSSSRRMVADHRYTQQQDSIVH